MNERMNERFMVDSNYIDSYITFNFISLMYLKSILKAKFKLFHILLSFSISMNKTSM